MEITHNLGFPRIGERRELKRASEGYWAGRLSREDLLATGRELRASCWRKQARAGIELIPSNDFSHYDHVLDTSCLVGNVPERFGWEGGRVDLDTMFAVARGLEGAGRDATPSEMTKWFDTNYHYIVPELRPTTEFELASRKPLEEFAEAKALGIVTKPVLLGPVSYLSLGRAVEERFDALELLEKLLPVYEQLLSELSAAGAEWIQLDEPVLSLDLTDGQRGALRKSYERLGRVEGLELMVASYFGDLGDNLEAAAALPVAALHVDALRGDREIEELAARLSGEKRLSLGLVDGRNVWKTDLDAALERLEAARRRLGGERLLVGPSCSLMHVPVTLRSEEGLDRELSSWLAFAEEKLDEIAFLGRAAHGEIDEAFLDAHRASLRSRRTSERTRRPAVRRRIAAIRASDERRASPHSERSRAQRARLALPSFPTTTIGSFPQTRAVRRTRARHRRGRIGDDEYERFLEARIEDAVRMQESLGFDVLVHGEFERNDMVEYFAERLEGYAFTANGWVQSYGSRYVKPPILYGDVQRPAPMTARWSRFAQSLTERPVKGMLTGPVTLVQWAFVRDDQPRSETARQVALAIRDEAVELEAAGLAVIQIDEAAFREGLPPRRADWSEYLDWAGRCFRLASSGVKDETRIHTHMCYSDFEDIVDGIAALDADCISIETSRSRMALLDSFVRSACPNEIGPGVYDIHSRRVPSAEEIVQLLERARGVLPSERIWVNPDCGLKTREWDDVVPALRHMIEAAREMRRRS